MHRAQVDVAMQAVLDLLCNGWTLGIIAQRRDHSQYQLFELAEKFACHML